MLSQNRVAQGNLQWSDSLLSLSLSFSSYVSPSHHSLTSPTEVAKVRVTLSHGQETRTVLSVTGATPTATTREPILTVGATVTELLTEVP